MGKACWLTISQPVGELQSRVIPWSCMTQAKWQPAPNPLWRAKERIAEQHCKRHELHPSYGMKFADSVLPLSGSVSL